MHYLIAGDGLYSGNMCFFIFLVFLFRLRYGCCSTTGTDDRILRALTIPAEHLLACRIGFSPVLWAVCCLHLL